MFRVDFATLRCYHGDPYFSEGKKFGVFRTKFDTTLPHIPRKLYKYHSPVVFSKR